MAFKILYLEESLIDLETIFRWSRERHPGSTEQFADDLFNHLDLLAAFLHVGSRVSGEPYIRRFLHSPLYVYYRVNERKQCIEILHFWHTARRDPKL